GPALKPPGSLAPPHWLGHACPSGNIIRGTMFFVYRSRRLRFAPAAYSESRRRAGAKRKRTMDSSKDSNETTHLRRCAGRTAGRASLFEAYAAVRMGGPFPDVRLPLFSQA